MAGPVLNVSKLLLYTELGGATQQSADNLQLSMPASFLPSFFLFFVSIVID